MTDITPTLTSANSVPITDKAVAVENPNGQVPSDNVIVDEELEEELIIEDFTIDGICGVY